MRTSRWLAASIAAAFVIASCGGDDGGSSSDTTAGAAPTAAPAPATTAAPAPDPATTAAPAPATTAAATPDTTAPPTTAAPIAGVTVGADGRYVPAECQGDNTADPASGVTETEVNIGMLGIDFKTLAQIGFAASGTDIRPFFQALVDDLNKKGGICGRTITFQGVLYDRLANKGGEGCVQVSKDVTNLMVLVQGGTPEAVCVAETGAVTFSQHDFSEEVAKPVLDNMFIAYPSWDEQVKATIQYAIDSGQLEGKKVGVWYGSIFLDQGNSFETLGAPLLDAAGVEYKAFRTDFSGPSDPQGNAALLTAASEFASMGIDVLLNFTGTTNHTGMQNELDAQGVKPIYISAPRSANSSNEIFAKAGGVEEIANGEQVVSFTETMTAITPDVTHVAACHEQLQALGFDPVEPATFDYSAAANMCFQFDMVVAALSIAGGDLNRETMAAAMEQLPPQATARGYSTQQFTADQHFSPAGWGVHVYDGSANTYSTESKFELKS